MARTLFGTDGIRAKAGDFPLDAKTAYGLGAALGRWAAAKSSGVPKVMLGMDTRESGTWLAQAVASGLRSVGAEAVFAGVVTTPGVAYLTKTGPFAAGVMISASHNPFYDNGLKVFDHSGYKLPDEVELSLEPEILRLSAVHPEEALPLEAGWVQQYTDFLKSTFPHSLAGWKLVVDCAHGAAYAVAPALLRSLGAEVVAVADQPDGRNINAGVGALHTKFLAAQVAEHKADLGIAFDGDADRAMFVSARGRLLDGDAVLLLAARSLQKAGQLPENRIVATVMSNLGLELALSRSGIAMTRTGVGDKYVLEEMRRSGAPLGGEQSGHVIFSRFSTTGDGLLTALRLLESLVDAGKSADQLLEDLDVFPQLIVNVRIKERKPLEQLPEVQDGIAACEKAFAGSGRVLVRFSGTEPLARVMVEGNDAQLVYQHAHSIARSIELALGA